MRIADSFRLLGPCALLCFLVIGIITWAAVSRPVLEEAGSQVTTDSFLGRFLSSSTTNTTTVVGDALQRVLGLNTKMPYPLMATLCIGKPLVIIAASGPPDADKTLSMMSKVLLTFTILSFLNQLVTDIWETITIFANNEFTIWERFNLAFAAFSMSPNPATILSLNAMSEVYQWVGKWRTYHGEAAQEDLMYQAFPAPLYWAASLLPSFCCIPMFLPLILYILPALVAYIWISLPMYAITSLLTGWVGYSGLMPMLLVKIATFRRFVKGQGMLPVGPVDSEQVKAKIKEDGWNDMAENYEANLDSYHHTNAPLEAWKIYFWGPITFGVPLTFFGPIAARLYSGHGYLDSVTLTLGERSFSAWMKPLLWSALEASDKADTFAAVHLVRRWLTEATYAI